MGTSGSKTQPLQTQKLQKRIRNSFNFNQVLAFQKDYQEFYKILFLGNTDSGKTSYFNRIISQSFIQNNKTVNFNFKYKIIKMQNTSTKILTELWDFSGDQELIEMFLPFYEDCDGIFIFYCLQQSESIDCLVDYLKLIQKHCKTGVKVMLINNKIDLIRNKEYLYNDQKTQLQELVLQYYLMHEQVSCKTGKNTIQSFQKLIQTIYTENINQNKIREDYEKNIEYVKQLENNFHQN